MNQPVPNKPVATAQPSNAIFDEREPRESRLRKINKTKNRTIGAVIIAGVIWLAWWISQMFNGGSGLGLLGTGTGPNNPQQSSDDNQINIETPAVQPETLPPNTDKKVAPGDSLFVLIDGENYMVRVGDTDESYEAASLEEVVAMAQQVTGENQSRTKVFVEQRWNASGAAKTKLKDTLELPKEKGGAGFQPGDIHEIPDLKP